jgi:hypothetical protein
MNIFSADHCEDKLGFAVPPGTVSVPFELDGAGQVRVPVALDGVELSAVISTGLPLTTLNQSVATDTLKVDLSGSDVKKSKIGSVTVYQRSFKTLGLGGFRVNAPVVEILPDIKGRNINRPSQTSQVSITGLNEVTTYTQTDEGRSLRREYKLPDVSIGANVLNGLHLYVAAKEKKIYLMPAAGAAP